MAYTVLRVVPWTMLVGANVAHIQVQRKPRWHYLPATMLAPAYTGYAVYTAMHETTDSAAAAPAPTVSGTPDHSRH